MPNPWEPVSKDSERLLTLPFNPVSFVTTGTPKEPIKRLVRIAETGSDVFSIGTAMVDGVVLYHYATGARTIVGIP